MRERVRSVTLVLVDENDQAVGELPPFDMALPWLQEVRGIVDAARERFGVDLTILRLVEAELRDGRYEAAYACTAEVRPAALMPTTRTLPDDVHRADYARPGGPADAIDWARGVLADRDLTITSIAQERTWNLSAVWTLDADETRYWLKSVPPFFDHEGALLELLREEAVPQVVAHTGGRTLMRDVPGSDRYDASVELMDSTIDVLIDLQRRWSTRVDDLLDAGVPDWRGQTLIDMVSELVARNADDVHADDRVLLREFVGSLPTRMAALESCGIPDSIVHGDFHPGNWRGPDGAVRIIDWGDAFVGHPLLDPPELLEKAPESERAGLQRRWLDGWARRLPDADPHRAGRLIEPLGFARMAAVYQMFVDNIERAEHLHHESDIIEFLGRTARALEREASTD